MKNKKSRSKTRAYCLEILYQRVHNEDAIEEVLDRYAEKYAVDIEFLQKLVMGILSKKSEIDALIEPHLQDRSLDEISDIEYAILSIGVYELMTHYDVPYKVVINESVNLAKQYGAVDAYKFINSIVDRVAKAVRGLECQT